MLDFFSRAASKGIEGGVLRRMRAGWGPQARGGYSAAPSPGDTQNRSEAAGVPAAPLAQLGALSVPSSALSSPSLDPSELPGFPRRRPAPHARPLGPRVRAPGPLGARRPPHAQPLAARHCEAGLRAPPSCSSSPAIRDPAPGGGEAAGTRLPRQPPCSRRSEARSLGPRTRTSP